MSKLSKSQKSAREILEAGKRYPLNEAIGLVKKLASSKFDESVDVALNLGVDPRKADQMIRGSCELPHGTGKTVRVLVIAKGEKAAEAERAGADHVGAEEIITKIQQEGWRSVSFENGWTNYDEAYNPAGYFKDSMGIVHLRGYVVGRAFGDETIFRLPVGYRPEYEELDSSKFSMLMS